MTDYADTVITNAVQQLPDALRVGAIRSLFGDVYDAGRDYERQTVALARQLKCGTVFVHKHFLAEGVRAQDVRQDPENDEFYARFEVTAVRKGRVYYRFADSPDARSWSFFDRDRCADYVRRVL